MTKKPDDTKWASVNQDKLSYWYLDLENKM